MTLVEYVIPYQIMETDKDKGTNRVVRNEITKVPSSGRRYTRKELTSVTKVAGLVRIT